MRKNHDMAHRYDADFEPRPITFPNGMLGMCSRVDGQDRAALIEYQTESERPPNEKNTGFVLFFYVNGQRLEYNRYLEQIRAIRDRRRFLEGRI